MSKIPSKYIEPLLDKYRADYKSMYNDYCGVCIDVDSDHIADRINERNIDPEIVIRAIDYITKRKLCELIWFCTNLDEDCIQFGINCADGFVIGTKFNRTTKNITIKFSTVYILPKHYDKNKLLFNIGRLVKHEHN